MQELTAGAVLEALADPISETVTPDTTVGEALKGKAVSAYTLQDKRLDVIRKREEREKKRALEQATHAIKCAACRLGVGTLRKAKDAEGRYLVDENGKQIYKHATCKVARAA